MRLKVIRGSARDFSPPSPEQAAQRKRHWQQFASRGTDIEEVRPSRGVESIECIYDAEMAAPFILEQVTRAEDERFDGVILSCMGDPALQAARQIARIPIIGAGIACYITAILLGSRFSIITPCLEGASMYENNLLIYGLHGHLASIRGLGSSVVDLRDDVGRLRQLMLDEGQKAVTKDGADVIIPGCSRIFGMSHDLSQELGVPVLDPRATVVRVAEMVVDLSLTHSKVLYPCPPTKRREI